MKSKDELLKALGANIRTLRKSVGMTQKELAYIVGKDQQSIQRLEAGNINPSFYFLYEIASGLNIELKTLFL